jgi:hypothetical protein
MNYKLWITDERLMCSSQFKFTIQIYNLFQGVATHGIREEVAGPWAIAQRPC